MRSPDTKKKDFDDRSHSGGGGAEPDFLGDGYDASRFGRDLIGGKLRWPASVLAAVNAGFLIFCFYDGEPPEMHFPVHLKGNYLFVVLFLTLIIYLFLAIKNWKSWLENKKHDA